MTPPGADARGAARHLAQNPFAGEEPARSYFTLLSGSPAPDAVEAFLATDFSPDQIRLAETTVYALYAGRYSDSRFNHASFERRLRVAATTRNYNTMTRLLELAHTGG